MRMKLKNNTNWGRIKGGLNSSGSTKKILIPEHSEKLAEFIGIILGDGNIQSYKRGKKIGVYSVRIAGDSRLDQIYHLTVVKPLGEELFGLKAGIYTHLRANEMFTCFYSKKLTLFLLEMGLPSGDKIHNQLRIPEWIKKKKDYLSACLRGLIDTDGSIFRMSRRDKNLIRIGFTNYNMSLLEDTRDAFIVLGYHPSKIIKNRAFVISRKNDVTKYINEVGFSNDKHRRRCTSFFSLVV